MHLILSIFRPMKLPALEKAVAIAQKTRAKKEPPDKQSQEEKDPLDAQPEIIEVDDMEPKKVQVKLSPKEKHLQVSIETLTLKSVLPVEVSHPQTARRGRDFHPGRGKRAWTGKTSDNSENKTKPTPSCNELEAAQSLVGMKEPQPKSESIHKLKSYDAKQTTESKDIVEIKPQHQVKPKLKCQARIKIKKKTETDIKNEDVVQEKPHCKMEDAAEKPEVSEATLCEEVQTLITEGKEM